MEEIILQKKTGASVSLSGNLTARLDGENLRFFHSHVENESVCCEKPLENGKNQLTENSFIYVGKISEDELSKETFSFCAHIKIDEASLSTLFVRERKNGEAYRFGGMTRKLKKLLCGESLAAKKRPVVCDEDGVIWLPGFPVADGKEGEITIYYVEV